MTTAKRHSLRLRGVVAWVLAFLIAGVRLAPFALAAPASKSLNASYPISASVDLATVNAAPAAFPAPLAGPVITATKVDSFPDANNDGKAEAGETITYNVTITNTGMADATGVQFNDTIDANTTLVPGSLQTQPIAGNDTYNVLGNVRIQPNAAAGLLANDFDPDTGSANGLTASGPTSSAQGGNVAINSDGSFSYNPPAGFEGTDSFTYTVTDASGKTDTATATFNISGMIWFINAGAAGGGDGRLTTPFNCLTGAGCFSAVNDGVGNHPAANDNIFLFSGAYTGGLTLLNNQKLIGASAGATLASIAGVTVPSDSDGLPPTGGAAPTVTTAVSSTNAINIGVANSNTLRGLNVGNTTGSKIASGASFGTLTILEVSLNGSGRALDLTGGTLNATFSSVSSSSGAIGISLTNVGGTANLGSGTLTGATGAEFIVNGGNATISYGGSITQNNAQRVVDIQNTTGGGVTLNGTVTGGASSTGVNLNNDNGNVSFTNLILGTSVARIANQAVTITGGTGTYSLGTVSIFTNNALGISATNADGALNVTTGTIDTGTATAINIDGPAGNTTLGITLSNVTKTGTTSGIVLRETTGSMVVSGGSLTSSGAGTRVIDFPGLTSGTYNFSGVTLNGNSSEGIDLTANNTGTYTFHDFDVNTPSGGVGVSVNGTNAVVTFRSIDQTGGTSGISLTNASGSFTVTGDAGITVNGTGGTISGVSDASVLLTTAANVKLNRMNLTNSGTDGVRGSNVNGFMLNLCNVSDTAGGVFDEGLEFDNLSGIVDITGSTVTGAPHNGIDIDNTSGTIASLSITNTQITNNLPATGGNGFLLQARGTSVINALTVTSCVFSGLRAFGVQVSSADTASVANDTIQMSTFSTNNIHAQLDQAGSSTHRFKFLNNTLNSADSTAFVAGSLTSTTGGALVGDISNNTLGTQGSQHSGSRIGNGFRLLAQGASMVNFRVQTNTVREVFNGRDLEVLSRLGSGGLALEVKNNLFVLPTGGTNVPGCAGGGCDGETVYIEANDTNAICADVANNTAYSPPSGLEAYRLRERASSTFTLEGTQANAQTQITSTNTGTPVVTQGGVDTTISIVAPGSCTALPAFITTTQDETAANFFFQSPVLAHSPLQSFARNRVVESRNTKPHGKAVKSQRTAVYQHAPASQRKKARGIIATPTINAAGGGSVAVNVGTLRPGDSVTITFQVTVNNPYTGGPNVSNQGTVSGSNFASVLTDDPAVGGAADPTLTPINAPPIIMVSDAQAAEPTSGSAPMLFTVSLSAPAPAAGVTVHYATADQAPALGHAAAGLDYSAVTDTVLSFASGEQIKTVSVDILADASAEPDETFLLNLSNPSGGNLSDGQAVGTITPHAAGTLLISELRTSGPAGAGDDFVELYNNTAAPLTITASDGSPGYGVFKLGADCNATPVMIATIPNGTVIPARGHYLLAGSGYSLSSYATADQPLAADIESDRNVAVFKTTDATHLSTALRLDAVGFGSNSGAVCDLLREGTNLAALSGSVLQYSFQRDSCGKGGNVATFGACPSSGNLVDVNDNSKDFLFADTSGANTAAGQRLGAPGPENSTSPIVRNNGFGATFVDPLVGAATSPNRVRNLTPDAVNNSTFGTLSIRRTLTNNTGAPVTRLRFRIVDITAFPVSGGLADLRARTSGDVVVSVSGGGSVTVRGTALEAPPAQGLGGALNSTLATGVVSLGTPLPNGASVSVQFLLGVQQTGSYKFYVNIEAAP